MNCIQQTSAVRCAESCHLSNNYTNFRIKSQDSVALRECNSCWVAVKPGVRGTLQSVTDLLQETIKVSLEDTVSMYCNIQTSESTWLYSAPTKSKWNKCDSFVCFIYEPQVSTLCKSSVLKLDCEMVEIIFEMKVDAEELVASVLRLIAPQNQETIAR